MGATSISSKAKKSIRKEKLKDVFARLKKDIKCLYENGVIDIHTATVEDVMRVCREECIKRIESEDIPLSEKKEFLDSYDGDPVLEISEGQKKQILREVERLGYSPTFRRMMEKEDEDLLKSRYPRDIRRALKEIRDEEKKKANKKREVKRGKSVQEKMRPQVNLGKEERKNIRKWEKLLAKETPKSYEFLEKLEKAMKKNNPVKAMKAEIEKHERLENQIWEEIKEDKEARSALVRYGKERLGKSLKDMQKNPWMINEKVLRKYHPKVADKIKAIKDSIEQRKKLESAANEQKLALETLKRVISKHKSLAKQTYNQRVKIIKKFMNKKIKRAR